MGSYLDGKWEVTGEWTVAAGMDARTPAMAISVWREPPITQDELVALADLLNAGEYPPAQRHRKYRSTDVLAQLAEPGEGESGG